MKRVSVLALVALLFGTPAVAQQTTRAAGSQRGTVSGGPAPVGTAGHGIPPAGQVSNNTAHATSGLHGSAQLVQRTGAGAAGVIPAKSAREQVQGSVGPSLNANGNALTAAQSSFVSGANVANGPNLPANPIIPGGSGPTAQLPAPRQPLSDVVTNPGTIRITVRAISAARQSAALDIDGRLAPIDRDLRSFADQFSYRNYRLLDVQTFELDFRSIAQMQLPGARAVAIEPRLDTDGQVHVHLELLKQNSEHGASMKTDFSSPRGSTFLVGGYRIDPNAPDGGTLLLAITQEQ